MNPRDRLQYALYLQRLHELFVIKENIAFQYPNAHYNKAAEQIDKVVDKCLDNNIKATVDGTHNLESPNLDHVISGALSSQQKMLVKTDDKYIQSAVEKNTKEFTRFIQNRIEKENYSLQAKIEKEYQKKKYQDMSEEQAKKLVRQKFQDSARKRAKNIVKDALHTNQSQISWTYNVNNGMKYKVWMNGQSKSGVRSWHIKSKIQPVEIDDFFDIYGPTGHARMMYPGDLNGGAENVANCRCWLHYTDIAPSNLKKKGTIQINPNVILEDENRKTFSANTETKGKTIKTKGTESTSSNQKEGLFSKIKEKILTPFRNIFRSNSRRKNNSITSNLNSLRHGNESEIVEYSDVNIIRQKGANYVNKMDVLFAYEFLPKQIRKYVSEIIIENKTIGKDILGSVSSLTPFSISLHPKRGVPSKRYISVIFHEAGHVLDHKSGRLRYNISNSKNWKNAINEDNQYRNKEGLGVPNEGYVSEYALEGFTEYNGHWYTRHRRFSEDFAESVRLFIEDEIKFKQDYPNRYRIIKKVLEE